MTKILLMKLMIMANTKALTFRTLSIFYISDSTLIPLSV